MTRILRRYDLEDDETSGFDDPAGFDDAAIAALDRSLARRRPAGSDGAPAAPGVRPQPITPVTLEREMPDIERMDDSDSDRSTDLDVHFGHQRWQGGASDLWG